MLKLTALVFSLLLAGCGETSTEKAQQESPRWVKTAELTSVQQPMLMLTGVVRARYETPQAFRVSGQIASRHVDAGQHVSQGDVLFTLDDSDLQAALAAARADLAATEASLAVSQSDLERNRQLLARDFLSQQAFDRTKLARREALTQRDAAQAQLEQARNALDYASLRAEADGLLIDVTGEPGQVVATGQAVAILAQEGRREIEVAFPSDVRPPVQGELLLDDRQISLSRREVAGAAAPASRTWRARYQLEDALARDSLGEVVQTRFPLDKLPTDVFRVTLAAIDERGDGPQLWQMVDGQAQPIAISIERVERDMAWVRGEQLRQGLEVISLGTHLLTPGMDVRPLKREAAQ